MAHVLICYSTTDGHTVTICQRIASVLSQAGHEVNIKNLNESGADDLAASDKIVIGASIRYGKHQQSVFDFIDKHKAMLQSKPSAFFNVNVVARKENKNTPETNPYMQKFLSQISWQPDRLAVFAGKIDYQKYGFLDRMMIRFIMWMTKGPTDKNAVVEFTDWDKVEAFASVVGEM